MQFLEKIMENGRKHRDIKLVATERRRNCLVSEPNYHTRKFLTENLLATEMKKAEMLMNKTVYLGLSILELSKILMYEFWNDYVKTNDIYKETPEDVETRFDTSNYGLDRQLPKGKNKIVIGLMKEKLGGKVTTKFVGLRAKTYSYLVDDGNEDKSKRRKKVCYKKNLRCENYKICLEATKLEIK